MQQHTDVFFYKFRFLFAGIITIAFLLLLSAVVTAIGANSVLAAKTAPSANTTDTSLADSPNVVTATVSRLGNGARHAMLSVGTALYRTCQSITARSAQSGRAIVHGSAAVVRGVGSGATAAARGVGDGVLFALHASDNALLFQARLPGKLVGSIIPSHTVSALIRPTNDKPIPVISGETSAAVLARFNAQQQQEVAKLLAAQLAANQDLEGSIIAGDPHHGGYPANWDNAPQDSLLDSWGMYNRECVSYAAWKVYQAFGHMPYWGGIGNANQWVRDAKAAGIPTGSTPKVHSVAISMRGYYGHAMWVEAVNGNMIYVSQYNYDLHGHYSEMWVNSGYFTYIYFK